MACPNCGSWSVKADRSLGGRMVCGRCGLPLGTRPPGNSRLRGGRRPLGLSRLGAWRPGRPLGWLLVLLGFGAALAALEPVVQRQAPVPAGPPGGWSQPPAGLPRI
ncbi:TFIIB-type zinc ribbon-containing protein [Vulcanococcus limneticus Candia 3F8]|uniref:TFIIB-type zinc ribbon-containing protein n=1 Tax=Vulcanococcus limneticus TaxID=2170428 RepID=UPI000B99269A|nr:TFIIB-type zinc ribbon-containing protein [Vulcanococcus limneticus]MCP9790973.1 TFIIB-type zinc ribbon-containing protein [Vulcanococcus limneticus MW73D5]MCP9892197.1 TFIIB-type zinc ribbon-containing protein [Vulcanococcus limneticus Candia 3F8]MCP9895981.1 TFIIB-type zinc ribbon-containing protein [Vulcanococcus limneticus Candia 3B3]